MLSSNNPFYPFDRADMQAQADYDGGQNVIYTGLALPGTALSDKKWQVEKHFYDGSNNWLYSRFAAPAGKSQNKQTNQYIHAWTDRTSLVYTAT